MFIQLTHYYTGDRVKVRADMIDTIRDCKGGKTLVVANVKGQYVRESAELVEDLVMAVIGSVTPVANFSEKSEEVEDTNVDDVTKGIYKHYKGNEYLVLGVARPILGQVKGMAVLWAYHTEELRNLPVHLANDSSDFVLYDEKEEMVIYKSNSGKAMYARPLSMFVEKVINEDGLEVNRFEFVEGMVDQ